jgi:catechol 2,3-dioxygenase-like lactoylglutathione lyase family enzyme
MATVLKKPARRRAVHGARVKALLHTALPSSNVERSIKFYRDLLGLKLLKVVPEPGNIKMAFMQTPAGDIIILTNGTRPPRKRGDENGVHFAFRVSPRKHKAAIATLKKGGVKFFKEHVREKGVLRGPQAYFCDPDKNVLEITV